VNPLVLRRDTPGMLKGLNPKSMTPLEQQLEPHAKKAFAYRALWMFRGSVPEALITNFSRSACAGNTPHKRRRERPHRRLNEYSQKRKKQRRRRNMHPQEVVSTLTTLFKRENRNVVIFLQGPPGVGKTATG
jgi:ATP-dependent Clp protease ATP-binding subunit ClpA